MIALANGITTTKSYDAAGRLNEIAHKAKDGTVLFAEASRYDERDRRTARIKGDGTVDLFAYDPAGQVIAAAYGQAAGRAGVPPAVDGDTPTTPTKGEAKNPNAFDAQQVFEYDPAGNRKAFQDIDGTKTEYQTNEANQYSVISVPSVAETQPSYDPNGNLLKDTKNTYTWDADIHLLSVSTRGAGDSPALKTEFRYDPLHRRVARLEPDGKLTHFIHDGWNVVAEYSSPRLQVSPSHSLHLVWGHDLSNTAQGAGGIGGLLSATTTKNNEPSEARQTAAGSPKGEAQRNQPRTTNTFHYDSNGNVVLLTNHEGKESARYQYDAFGKSIASSGDAAEANKYRFSTKPIEEGSGLAFYGFRYYSPDLGRWTARDPIGEGGGMNLFGFVLNRTINDVDRLGRDPLNESDSLECGGTVWPLKSSDGWRCCHDIMPINSRRWCCGTDGSSWQKIPEHEKQGKNLIDCINGYCFTENVSASLGLKLMRAYGAACLGACAILPNGTIPGTGGASFGYDQGETAFRAQAEATCKHMTCPEGTTDLGDPEYDGPFGNNAAGF